MNWGCCFSLPWRKQHIPTWGNPQGVMCWGLSQAFLFVLHCFTKIYSLICFSFYTALLKCIKKYIYFCKKSWAWPSGSPQTGTWSNVMEFQGVSVVFFKVLFLSILHMVKKCIQGAFKRQRGVQGVTEGAQNSCRGIACHTPSKSAAKWHNLGPPPLPACAASSKCCLQD